MITVYDSVRLQQAVAERDATDPALYSCLVDIVTATVGPGSSLDCELGADEEMLSFVVDGCLDYRDDCGTRRLVMGGEARVLQATSGNSETNASHSEALQLVRARLRTAGSAEARPRHQQRYYSDDERFDKLCLLASSGTEAGALSLAADAKAWAATTRAGEPLLYYRPRGRRAWLQLARGTVRLNDVRLEAGDGAAIDGDDDSSLRILGEAEAELVLLDLP